tara:strand:+ start:189 stop:839 length:651 start_codon:yes stop_codon:yes gene_type:complete
MSVDVKICGINDQEGLEAAIEAGARYVGFVFYGPSPRHVTYYEATKLTKMLPENIVGVGLAVDPDDVAIDNIRGVEGLSMLQLHGSEAPERVKLIKERLGKKIIKAIKVSKAGHLKSAEAYYHVSDMLLFDAKVPSKMKNALPGGNALSFDWTILAGRNWALPWMLSGGLNKENACDAIQISGAQAVDVSSGVERFPGIKERSKIFEFIETVRNVR